MNLALTPGVPFFAPPPPTGAGVDDGVANVSSRPSLPREGQTVAGHVSERIPADLSEAFDQAVNAVIAWDSAGEEPTVAVYGRPVLVSVIASLCETYKDVMPTKLYWRVVRHANGSLERRARAVKLSKDSSYESGAQYLLQWVQDNECKFGE